MQNSKKDFRTFVAEIRNNKQLKQRIYESNKHSVGYGRPSS